MIPFFLSHRLRRIGRRPAADPEARAFVRAALVRAGYLPNASLWITRLRVTLASFAVFITGMGGMVSYAYASDAVLPDTPLYPIRESIERLAIDLAPTPTLHEQAVQTQLKHRKKEATLLKALNKPLPAVHARILLKEELRAQKGKHSTSSTEILFPLLDLSKEDRREQREQLRTKEKKDFREPGEIPASIRVFSTSTPFVIKERDASSTRSRLKLRRELRHKQEEEKRGRPERSRR